MKLLQHDECRKWHQVTSLHSFSPAPKTLHTSTPWTRVPTSWLVLNWAHHAYSLCVRSDRVCPDSEAPTQICRLGINSPSFPKSNNWIEHPPKDQLTKKWYKVLERAKDCYSNPHSYTRWLVRRGICLWETLAQSSRDCRVLGQEEARGLMRKKRNSEDSKLRSMSPYKENLKYLCTYKTRDEEDDEDDKRKDIYYYFEWIGSMFYTC